jgi:hypothetical protein
MEEGTPLSNLTNNNYLIFGIALVALVGVGSYVLFTDSSNSINKSNLTKLNLTKLENEKKADSSVLNLPTNMRNSRVSNINNNLDDKDISLSSNYSISGEVNHNSNQLGLTQFDIELKIDQLEPLLYYLKENLFSKVKVEEKKHSLFDLLHDSFYLIGNSENFSSDLSNVIQSYTLYPKLSTLIEDKSMGFSDNVQHIIDMLGLNFQSTGVVYFTPTLILLFGNAVNEYINLTPTGVKSCSLENLYSVNPIYSQQFESLLRASYIMQDLFKTKSLFSFKHNYIPKFVISKLDSNLNYIEDVNYIKMETKLPIILNYLNYDYYYNTKIVSKMHGIYLRNKTIFDFLFKNYDIMDRGNYMKPKPNKYVHQLLSTPLSERSLETLFPSTEVTTSDTSHLDRLLLNNDVYRSYNNKAIYDNIRADENLGLLKDKETELMSDNSDNSWETISNGSDSIKVENSRAEYYKEIERNYRSDLDKLRQRQEHFIPPESRGNESDYTRVKKQEVGKLFPYLLNKGMEDKPLSYLVDKAIEKAYGSTLDELVSDELNSSWETMSNESDNSIDDLFRIIGV